MHRHRAPSSRMLFVISPPPVSPPRLPFPGASARITSGRKRRKAAGGRREKEREGVRDSEREERVEREGKRDRLLCDTRLPRIPERRLSPLPLNIHPLGKADKNKEKARSTIPSRPSLHFGNTPWRLGSPRSRCPATRGSLFILKFILY